MALLLKANAADHREAKGIIGADEKRVVADAPTREVDTCTTAFRMLPAYCGGESRQNASLELFWRLATREDSSMKRLSARRHSSRARAA
jgi:hypothetical protein